MKKILHICNSSFYLKNFLQSHINDLIKNNYEVHVICNMDNKKLKFNKRIKLHDVKFPQSFSPISFLKSIIEVNKIVRKFNFNCVISHNRNSSVVGRIATYFSKVPLNVYFAHGFYFHDDQNFISFYLSVQIERFLQKITTYTLSQSKEDMELMIKKNYISKKKIIYVGNGIDNLKFKYLGNKIKLKKKIGLSNNSFVIAGVGRLVKGKGFQDLIEAFYKINKKHKNCYLLIIGGVLSHDISKYEKKIIDRIKKLQIEKKVILTGMIDNVYEYLNCSDIYVLSSFREGVSRSMLEAMSCKIPVISTKIRGSREIIKNLKNGILYEKSDISQLEYEILRLKNNKKLAKKISSKAYNDVKNFYTENLYNIRIFKIINKLIKCL